MTTAIMTMLMSIKLVFFLIWKKGGIGNLFVIFCLIGCL